MSPLYRPVTRRVCRIIGHRWSDWHPVGHIEGASHRWCLRGCTEGQMPYD